MIKLFGEWYLGADANNFILIRWDGKRLRSKSTEPKPNETFFYSTIESFINGLKKHATIEAFDSPDFETVCEKLQAIFEAIDSMLPEIQVLADNLRERGEVDE